MDGPLTKYYVRHKQTGRWARKKPTEYHSFADGIDDAAAFDSRLAAQRAMTAEGFGEDTYDIVPRPDPASPTDWQGKPVPPGEAGDDHLLVWEVTPHPGSERFDVYVERSWQRMNDYVAGHLATFLERFDEAQLRAGVTLTFKVADSSPAELEELVDE